MGETPNEDRELRNLMTQYQRADPAALNELVARISPPLLRYFSASRFGRNDAEDLLQDCWIRIHRSRHTYRASEPVMPWIYAIARHTRLDAYRKRRRLESREVLVATLPEPLYQMAPRAAPEQDALEQMVASLPESQREVIVMLKVAGMTLEEVARTTSSTVGAVKQKAHRAYETLRRALGKEQKDAN
ncbi:MAG TPA: RNA polymerase sigma factor [Bryobacteraceae bacterium]|nr:RNA polymerase sigma factor [Bryobacteraceae bacterium]